MQAYRQDRSERERGMVENKQPDRQTYIYYIQSVIQAGKHTDRTVVRGVGKKISRHTYIIHSQ